MTRIFASLFLAFALILSAASAPAAYIFTNVVDNTTAAPVGTFNGFGSAPGLDGNTAVFFAFYNSGGNVGIFTGSGGALTTISKSGDAAPIGTFDDFSQFSGLSGSTTGFRGRYNGSSTRGIFTGSGGALTTIAKLGDAAPVGTFSAFGTSTDVSGSTAAFQGAFNGGANSGIFTGSGGALTTIAKTGDAAPIGTFTGLNSGVSFSGSTVAFLGSYNAGAQGIFTGSGGALTTIAKTGDAAPVGTFSGLSEPALSGSTAAFRGFFGANQGIFTGSGGALTTIAKTGDAAPVGTFTGFFGVSFSGSTAAFLGTFGVDFGIFTGSGGAVTPVILTGDSLFGSTVTNLSLGSFGADANSLAIYYLLADGRDGIAIATVPEPSTMVLAGLAATGLAVVALRRRRLCKPKGCSA